MSVQAKPSMTVDAFLAWAEGQPGRYELIDGEVVAMSPERLRHAETKLSVHIALLAAVRAAKLPCRVLPDGMSVKVDAKTVFEPDALVYCGKPLDPDTIVIPEPMIVVEVLSPGTANVDFTAKLGGYFKLPSLAHYLILDPRRRMIIHHRRGEGDLIETRIASSGELRLDPPGLTLPVAALFDA